MPTRTRRIMPSEPIIGKLIKRAKTLSGLRTEQDVIDKALRSFIEHLEHHDVKRQKSFYEMTKHLAGSVEGPTDLAYNKKYMQGFGR